MSIMEFTPNKQAKTPLYEQVAQRVSKMIEQGTLRPGDRVPSIRRLSQQLQVSINTVKEAYGFLEDRRVLKARPQSGYYVSARRPAPPAAPSLSRSQISPTRVSLGEVSQMIIRDTLNPELIQFGCAIPDPALLPTDKLARMLGTEARRHPIESVSYAVPPGCEALRTQIARRMVQAGCNLSPEEVVITTGCSEAMMLALRALCAPGDIVAVESPVYFNFLQLIEQLGLRALEIPCTPNEGMSLEALEYALEHNRVKACIVITNFNNPLGCLMPEGKKRQLVEMLGQKGIPLVEDDIYGDLSFDEERPSVAQRYDSQGEVLLCSSFSKTLAPGYRVGWIAPGRYQKRIEALQMVMNLCSATPTQLAVAEFLANGGYDRYLRSIRREYAKKVACMSEDIGRSFPEGTRVTRPRGGFTLWVEMPTKVDSLELYDRALKHGITITPGPLFSASGKYRNCVRLNAAFYSERTAGALATLGRLACELATS